MLISVNPFKKLEIYGTNLMEKYYNPNPNIALNLPPHLFEISQKAFTNLMAKFNPQSIVISGFLIIISTFTIIIIIHSFRNCFLRVYFYYFNYHFPFTLKLFSFLIYPFSITPFSLLFSYINFLFLIISESGAGKTEATKCLMKYLVHMSSKSSRQNNANGIYSFFW